MKQKKHRLHRADWLALGACLVAGLPLVWILLKVSGMAGTLGTLVSRFVLPAGLLLGGLLGWWLLAAVSRDEEGNGVGLFWVLALGGLVTWLIFRSARHLDLGGTWTLL